MKKLDLTDTNTTLHQKIAGYRFFPSSHGTFSRRDHILGHKTSLRFKNTETLQSIFLDHNGMMLEISNKRGTGRLLVLSSENGFLIISFNFLCCVSRMLMSEMMDLLNCSTFLPLKKSFYLPSSSVRVFQNFLPILSNYFRNQIFIFKSFV